MARQAFQGLLIRLPTGAAPAAPALAAAAGGLELEPLFDTSAGTPGLGAAAAGGATWYAARPKGTAAAGLDAAEAWDLAYQAAESRGPGAAAADAGFFVEPDWVQDWLVPGLETPAEGLAAGGAACVFEDQADKLPRRPGEFAWHLADDFSQLRAARGAVGGNQVIRIAHLDTGYDAEHATFPADRFDEALQRNFIDRDRLNDARDLGVSGMLKNPGHGAATLAILAGGAYRFPGSRYDFNEALGGAPGARVVEVRVGNSVVQLNTASVARGISYCADLTLSGDPAKRVDVISMSMGGVASEAWADAVNKVYEAGVVFVAAAGNNISGGFFAFPTRHVVFPARFRRVVAACGVMADRRPYDGLPFGTMQGNFGPDSKMATAMAAYTPNMPWARLGCGGLVDMNGAGTSAATPQVAAAAALYFAAHAAALFDRGRYPEAWMRVEAVRHALFATADRGADGGSRQRLGNGILRAADALRVPPADRGSLVKAKKDSASFAFLRALTGVGVAPPTTVDRMLELEATQLAQIPAGEGQRHPLEAAVADPDLRADDVTPQELRQYLEGLVEHPRASQRLKRRARETLDQLFGRGGGTPGKPSVPVTPAKPQAAGRAPAFEPPRPPFRSLRGYAIDPSLSTSLHTAEVSQVTFDVPWEPLKPGPVGEYVEVIDVDPASQCAYEPVDLNDPALLAQDGLPPSEGTPQFHQQMVYAVCSLTIKHFEHALGRRALWRPGPPPKGANPRDDSHFVRRLRVYPHALREPNAYFSPDKVALLFGYFNASADDPGGHLPGGRVFTCLSHDIIAHETTHALLDGMHRQFLLPSNPDVRAFHEAFADIVALFQHFTFPEILRHQIASTRGALRTQQSLLGELAGQFGRATGRRGALRHGIGRVVDGKWVPYEPKPDDYDRATGAHDRGAVLVGAVFDAFLSIYERRTADLLRLSTEGTGVLREGQIHPDLVGRLADEAAKAAGHVLTMCIRALDYCPPTDVTFGEYLRAVITADYELVRDDDLNYRVAFVEAFRRRGIYPRDVRTLSVESLLWRGPHNDDLRPSDRLRDAIELLKGYAADHLYATRREQVFHLQREMRRKLHGWLDAHFASGPAGRNDAEFLGLNLEPGPDGGRRAFEVHAARFAQRTSPDGDVEPQLLLSLLQQTRVKADPADARADMPFEGGSTIVVDLRNQRVLYCIRKRVNSPTRLARQQEHAASLASLRGTYLGVSPFGTEDEPFALLHRGV